MRRTEREGFIRGTPKALEDGVEIARWSSRGGAHWLSLVEHVSPVAGAHWSYTANDAGGGYTQLEGYDRHRVFGEMLRQIERMARFGTAKMALEFSLVQIAPDEALARLSAPVESLLVAAQWQGLPESFFSGLVRKAAEQCQETKERVDARACAGMRAQLLYLVGLHQRGEPGGVSAMELQQLIEGAPRRPACTAADWAAHALIVGARSQAAEDAFQQYDFAPFSVEDAGGWESVTAESPAGEYSRTVRLSGPGADAQESASFRVWFDGHSISAAGVSALLLSTGEEVGCLPGQADEGPRV